MDSTIKVRIPPDGKGFVGRECPNCEAYFKVKFGTGLPINYCTCPYCDQKANHDEFFTRAQIEYAKSVGIKQLVDPLLKDFGSSLKKLERSTRGSFIQIKIKLKHTPFRIAHYQEQILETEVTCDNCGLEFAIYGVFSNCPDCGQLNARAIFQKSIEVAKKRILLSEQEGVDDQLKEELLADALSGGVSSFDSFGKALIAKFPSNFPGRTRNLFQKIAKLSEVLANTTGKNIVDLTDQQSYTFFLKMFQVRHIYEHNAGVIDDDFVRKEPSFSHLKGRKYKLEKPEILEFLDKLDFLGQKIFSAIC